jgi:hypothetical protein
MKFKNKKGFEHDFLLLKDDEEEQPGIERLKDQGWQIESYHLDGKRVLPGSQKKMLEPKRDEDGKND